MYWELYPVNTSCEYHPTPPPVPWVVALPLVEIHGIKHKDLVGKYILESIFPRGDDVLRQLFGLSY